MIWCGSKSCDKQSRCGRVSICPPLYIVVFGRTTNKFPPPHTTWLCRRPIDLCRSALHPRDGTTSRRIRMGSLSVFWSPSFCAVSFWSVARDIHCPGIVLRDQTEPPSPFCNTLSVHDHKWSRFHCVSYRGSLQREWDTITGLECNKKQIFNYYQHWWQFHIKLNCPKLREHFIFGVSQ